MIYITVKEALQVQLGIGGQYKTIDWYNEQEKRTEDLKAIVYPACFIEILDPVTWKTMGNKEQHGQMSVKLHHVINSLVDTPDAIMALAQTTHLRIHNKGLYVGTKQITSELTRTASDFPKRYAELKIMTETYTFECYDDSTAPVLVEVLEVDFVIPMP